MYSSGGFFMRIVDKKLNIPLYIQLTNIIREMIEVEDLTEGDYLMPERELCEVQGVSRMTANKAIASLVTEGLLIRHQGKGTIVATKKPVSRYQGLESLSKIQEKKGLEVTNELLSFIEIPVSKWVKRKLKLSEDTSSETIYKIRRIRYLEGEPLALESIYLDKKMCPALNEKLIAEHSMYDLYTEKYQHQLAQAEQIIRPTILNDAQAELLKQPKNDLALRINRRLYTQKGEVMEYTESIFLSQKHDFEVVLT